MALYNENGNKIKSLPVKDDALTEHVYERFLYPDGQNVGRRLHAAVGTKVTPELTAAVKAAEIKPGENGQVV